MAFGEIVISAAEQYEDNYFYRPIVLVSAISHKFKQIQMQNVDFVQFSHYIIISDI